MGYWESCSPWNKTAGERNKTAGERETFQPGEAFSGGFLGQVSAAWLGADVKVSFCLIFSLWLQSLSLLCLWPF